MAERRPLRILLYRPPWRNNEPYFRAQQVATHFRRAGDQVTVVAGPHGWRSLVRLLSWPWHLARADLIFLYPQPLLPLFALTAWWLGRRVVIDHYISYVRMAEASPRAGRWLAAFDKAAYRRADAVLAHTESVAREVQAAHALPDDLVHTVYSVVDTTLFCPIYDDEATRLRRELRLEGRFVVFYHGLWHRWHGVDVLRAAVQELVEAGESVALVLLGRAGQGAAHECWLGEVPYRQLPAHIQMANVWCSGFIKLPRGDRSFSSTMIQALAMARPVITSSNTEKDQYLQDGVSAIYVPPADPMALSQAIRSCMREPLRCQEIGQAGRQVAIQYFDERHLADFLHRVCETRTPRQRSS